MCKFRNTKNRKEEKMRIFGRNIKMVLLLTGIAAVICLAAISVRPSYAVAGNNSTKLLSGTWLSQYEGHNMRVTFVDVPTYLGAGLSKTSSLKLLEAGSAGIVVTFRPTRTVFFPYSEIAAIEPIYTSN